MSFQKKLYFSNAPQKLVYSFIVVEERKRERETTGNEEFNLKYEMDDFVNKERKERKEKEAF